ncbi:MAG: hypothetical protein ACTSO2_14535 [Promethearchaeota archaeon]
MLNANKISSYQLFLLLFLRLFFGFKETPLFSGPENTQENMSEAFPPQIWTEIKNDCISNSLSLFHDLNN